MSDPCAEYLAAVGTMADEEIDPARAAICIAAPLHPGISLERFFHSLSVLASETTERHAALLAGGAADDVPTRLAALKHILSDRHGYAGDEDAGRLENYNLIRTIERRRGSSIALAILYMHAARAQGWAVAGLSLPGHFICRLEKDGERVLFDPAQACAVLGAADLRQMVKRALGSQAELSAQYYNARTNREILIGLQNSIKFRQIESEDYAAALETVRVMRMIDHEEYRLHLDAGVLYARLGQMPNAAESLRRYIKAVPDARERRDAEMLLMQISEEL